MRVIEEKHKHMSSIPQVDKKYLYRCPNCGSLIEINKSDIKYNAYMTDIWEYFSCPVCRECVDTPLIGRFLHRDIIYKFFYHKYRHV